jgi:drug/metabolite transporter (DMT)-like permease
VLGAVAFSGKAIIIKLAYRYGVDPVTLIMLRMLFALPLFMLMAWWGGRGKPALAGRDWLSVFWLGLTGYYLASFLDFVGLQYVSASLERLVLYLNPTLVLLLGWLLHRQSIQWRQGLAMAVSYAGILLMFSHEFSLQGRDVGFGAAMVFLSALCYAWYLVHSGRVVPRLGSLRLVGLASVVACLLCIAQFLVLQPLSAARVAEPVIWLSVLNAVACTAIPVLLVMMAVERIGAAATAQTGMVGPLATLMMGVLILGEPLNLWVIAGTVLVLGGVYLMTRGPRPAA